MAETVPFSHFKNKQREKNPGDLQFVLEVYHDGETPAGFITSKPAGLTPHEALRVFADQLDTVVWAMRKEAQTLEPDLDRGDIVGQVLIYQSGVRTRIDLSHVQTADDKHWLAGKLEEAFEAFEMTINED